MKLYSFDYDGFRGYANAQDNWTLVLFILAAAHLPLPAEPLSNVEGMRDWLLSAGEAEFDNRSNVSYGYYRNEDHQLVSYILSKIERGHITTQGTSRLGFQRWRGKSGATWHLIYRLQDPN